MTQPHSRNPHTRLRIIACTVVSATALGVTGAVTGTVTASAHSRGGTASLIDRTAGLVTPRSLHVASGEPRAQAERVVHAAQTLYTFWNTGNTAYLRKVLAPSFHDNTLPPGRPQGPAGPAVASRTFRAAVPDLTCELADLYVVGNTFTARLVFRGHFTGTDDGVKGHGQRIDFIAFDIQRLNDRGRITEDWHLEDNLTFLTQAGLVTVAGEKPQG